LQRAPRARRPAAKRAGVWAAAAAARLRVHAPSAMQERGRRRFTHRSRLGSKGQSRDIKDGWARHRSGRTTGPAVLRPAHGRARTIGHVRGTRGRAGARQQLAPASCAARPAALAAQCTRPVHFSCADALGRAPASRRRRPPGAARRRDRFCALGSSRAAAVSRGPRQQVGRGRRKEASARCGAPRFGGQPCCARGAVFAFERHQVGAGGARGHWGAAPACAHRGCRLGASCGSPLQRGCG
jgi:hypothetical protein